MKQIDIGTSIYDSESKEYTILELLSDKGGFTWVYKAQRKDDGFLVAVKVVKNNSDLERLQGMKNEYDLAQKVDSQHAIKYFYLNEPGQNDFPCYLIMEYANNGTLDIELRERSLANSLFTDEEMKSIMKQLVDGMIDISKEIVHRDIKPENILKDNDLYKISDYGISKANGEETRSETMKGWRSVFYYAPESWLGYKGCDTTQMDIYAMGIVFYQIANLEYPYLYNPMGGEIEIRRMHTSYSIKQFRPGIDPAIQSMILKMMKKPIFERFNNWDEIKEFLDTQISSSPKEAFIDRLVEQENKKIIAEQISQSKIDKNADELKDKFERCKGQVIASIYDPLNNIVELFNKKSASSQMSLSKVQNDDNRYWNFELLQPNGNRICFNFEMISMDNYKPINKVMLATDIPVQRAEQIEPQYSGKKIIAWGSIASDCGMGINVLLLDEGDDFSFEEIQNLITINSSFGRNTFKEQNSIRYR